MGTTPSPSRLSTTPTPYEARSKRALSVRHHGEDSPQAVEAGRDLRAVMLEEHVRRVVAVAPPLTAEQKTRLAALLLVGAE